MRILVLSDRYPPAATGGYERSCADVVRHWRAAGHHVTVLTTPAAGPAEAGVARTLPDPDEPSAAIKARAAVEHLFAGRVDVVSAWNLARVPVRAVLEPLFRAGIPTVFVVCDGWLDGAPADLTSAPEGSVLAYVSEALRRSGRPPAWAPRRAVVMHSGIDADIFGGQTAKTEQRWDNRLLFVGRLAPAKGVDAAVTALALLPAARLTVAGPATEPRTAELADLAASLGVTQRLKLLGPVARPELPRLYRAADALLFPSRWAEPFGLVPLEAMACGTPVIATGTGGSAEYLQDGGNALIVPPGDPDGLVAAVRRLTADPGLRRRLIAGGAATWPHYTVARLATTLAALHRDAANVES